MLWRKIGVEKLIGFAPPPQLIFKLFNLLSNCMPAECQIFLLLYGGLQLYFGHLFLGTSISAPPPPCYGLVSVIQDCVFYYIRSRPARVRYIRENCLYFLFALSLT